MKVQAWHFLEAVENGSTCSDAASRSGRVESVTALLTARRCRPRDTLCLRPYRPLPRRALAECADRIGDVEFLRPRFLCPHCHNGQFPGRCRSGRRQDRTVSRRVPHVGAGCSEAPFDHWSPTDEDARRAPSDHPGGRTYGGIHRWWHNQSRADDSEPAIQLD